MTKRAMPTTAQHKYLAALLSGDTPGLAVATSPTRVACRCAGWCDRAGRITPMGRDVLRQMMEMA